MAPLVQASGPVSHTGGAREYNFTGGIQGTGGTAYPLRGAKFNAWEGGTRTPVILVRLYFKPQAA
jgi:hypothetical protein